MRYRGALNAILSVFLSPVAAPVVLLIVATGQVLALRTRGIRFVMRATTLYVCLVGACVVANGFLHFPDAKPVGTGLLFICFCGLPVFASAVAMSLVFRRHPTTTWLLWLSGVSVGLLIYVPALWVFLSLMYTIY